MQSIINERRPSRLKPTTAFTYGQLYVKEEPSSSSAVEAPLSEEVRNVLDDRVVEEEDEEEDVEDERKYVSVGVGSSSVELRIFVDGTESQRSGGEEETRADSEPEVVVVQQSVGDYQGKRRKKSPGKDT